MLTKVYKRILLTLVFTLNTGFISGQRIFAHNDYAKTQPFYKAFELKADYIEADVFLHNGVIVVAHDHEEIDPSKTLKSMYLQPLLAKRKELYGLTLMIDLKEQVLHALVKELNEFPELISNPRLTIVISGNYPPPPEWKDYPSYIWFDGRPDINYTDAEQKRLRMISTSFNSISKWNGTGEIPESDLIMIKHVIRASHDLKQPIRFWGAPDFENAWSKLTALGVDIINSDNVETLAAYLKTNR